jgi:hypothetical protein
MPVLGVYAQGSPIQLYIPVRSVEGASLTNGFLVGYRIGTAASWNMNNAVLMASGTAPDLPGFIGVATADIADTAYGIALVAGYAASVRFSNVGTSITINSGDPLVPGAARGGAFSLAPTYAASGLRFILASNVPVAVSAAGWMSGLARCL